MKKNTCIPWFSHFTTITISHDHKHSKQTRTQKPEEKKTTRDTLKRLNKTKRNKIKSFKRVGLPYQLQLTIHACIKEAAISCIFGAIKENQLLNNICIWRASQIRKSFNKKLELNMVKKFFHLLFFHCFLFSFHKKIKIYILKKKWSSFCLCVCFCNVRTAVFVFFLLLLEDLESRKNRWFGLRCCWQVLNAIQRLLLSTLMNTCAFSERGNDVKVY